MEQANKDKAPAPVADEEDAYRAKAAARVLPERADAARAEVKAHAKAAKGPAKAEVRAHARAEKAPAKAVEEKNNFQNQYNRN